MSVSGDAEPLLSEHEDVLLRLPEDGGLPPYGGRVPPGGGRLQAFSLLPRVFSGVRPMQQVFLLIFLHRVLRNFPSARDLKDQKACKVLLLRFASVVHYLLDD